jgi:hypothetical protein
MALPVIVTPTYELEIPSNKEKLTYRPFLVKEEKLLLLAMESESEAEMVTALKQIIKNCTYEKIDVDSLALFDLEYIFLRVRAKSVGEVSELKLLCEDDGETYADVKVNLEEVNVDFQKDHSNIIKLTDTISMKMEYPQIDIMGADRGVSDTKYIFGMIKDSISQIIEGETIYERVDFTDTDLDEFIDSLSSDNFKSVQGFFETMPKLRHEVKFKNPKTKKQNKIVLEGMQSFFA